MDAGLGAGKCSQKKNHQGLPGETESGDILSISTGEFESLIKDAFNSSLAELQDKRPTLDSEEDTEEGPKGKVYPGVSSDGGDCPHKGYVKVPGETSTR